MAIEPWISNPSKKTEEKRAVFDHILDAYRRIPQKLLVLDPHNLYFPETLANWLQSYHVIVFLYQSYKELQIFTPCETQMLVALETLSYTDLPRR